MQDMNMCGVHTKTIFNTKFLEIPEFCVNTHTHTHNIYSLLSEKEGFRICLKRNTHDMVSFAITQRKPCRVYIH